MIDVNSYQEYLRDNGYGQDKEEHKRHIWLSAEMANQLNAIIAEHDGHVTTRELAQVIPAMPQRFAGWFNKTAHKFFFELTDFLEADQGSYEVCELISQIKNYRVMLFQERAAREVRSVREEMLPIPDDAKIAPEWLGGLTNEEFIQAFSDLQGIVIGAYLDIEQDAFAWGFPTAHSTEKDLRGRVGGVIVSLGCSANIKNNILTVDSAYFKPMIKDRRKIPLVIAGLESLGLVFDGYSPKAEKFTVSYPDNPNVMWVLKVYGDRYAQGFCRRCDSCKWRQGGCPCKRMMYNRLFSYRYFENTTVQEQDFLVEADRLDDDSREIALWLRDNASDYGYQLNPHKVSCHEMLSLKDITSKKCCDRQKCILFGHKSVQYADKFMSFKAMLGKVFIAEPDKISALAKRFPLTFVSYDSDDTPEACCHQRECGGRFFYKIDGKLRYRCKWQSFDFKNPTLDDVKDIMELLAIERSLPKIKPTVEGMIEERLSGEAKKLALDIVAYVQSHKKKLRNKHERWDATYKGERLFTISLRSDKWFIVTPVTFDDMFFVYIEREGFKELLWDNLQHCFGCDFDRQNCGNIVDLTACGRKFERICNNKLVFRNPDASDILLARKVIEYRINNR